MQGLRLDRPGEPAQSTLIQVGAGALEAAGAAAARSPCVLLVTDSNLCKTPWPDRVAAACEGAGGPRPHRSVLGAGEQGKTLAAAETLWSDWAACGAGRDAIVLAVGGGVVTDVAGFAASTYMRGTGWMAVPTTVLAMADAALGGKTGVNLSGAKNLVGTFWHPRSIHVAPESLSTLAERHYEEGWAEVVKAGAIADAALFERLEREAQVVRGRHQAVVGDLLLSALRVKCAVVERDAREAGAREILNFGHTWGHALETASENALSHGEAVAIGMVVEARLGVRLGRCSEELPRRLEACCRGLGLPTGRPAGLDEAKLAAALGVDKKRRAGQIGRAAWRGRG